jgi:hypothetical protein
MAFPVLASARRSPRSSAPSISRPLQTDAPMVVDAVAFLEHACATRPPCADEGKVSDDALTELQRSVQVLSVLGYMPLLVGLALLALSSRS